VPLVDLPEDRIASTFDELFGVNLKGYLLGAKAAYRELAKTRGSIIFTASNAGFYPCGGGPLYTGSKHAVVGLIRQLAYELAPKIRVNGVAPGAIPTDLRGPASLAMAERSIAELPMKEMVEHGLPLGTLPEPRDYTGSYVLLASGENSCTATGSVIICDGGIHGFVNAAGGRNLWNGAQTAGRYRLVPGCAGSRCQSYFGDNLVPRSLQSAIGRSHNKAGSLQNLKIVVNVLIVALHSAGRSSHANGSDLVNDLKHLQPSGRENL
jgi:Enoyl-(Acyl carrier protein) reductase